ncbi:hypothetical protein K4W80_16720, partial [Pseudomonas aeruginosa]|nr:hypothetical protein [Pseudomonas aeruginosa]
IELAPGEMALMDSAGGCEIIPHEHPDSTRPSLRRPPAHSDLRIPPVCCDKTAPGIFPARE